MKCPVIQLTILLDLAVHEESVEMLGKGEAEVEVARGVIPTLLEPLLTSGSIKLLGPEFVDECPNVN